MAVDFGADLADFPEGYTVLEVVASFKVLDPEGNVQLIERVTPGLSKWEALGMITTLSDTIRQELISWHMCTEEDD